MKIDKMSAEVFGQMLQDENISNSLSAGIKKTIKKIGMTAMVAGTLCISSGMAQASDFKNIILGAGVLSGVISNGSKSVGNSEIDCDTAGKNGWKIGGSAVLGGILGNQVGGGTGKDLATVAGAVIGGAMANNSEEERIKQECARRVGYNDETPNVGIPRYASRTSYVNEPIIYESRAQNGESYWVTAKGSPGLAALRGNRNAINNLDDNEMARAALDRHSAALVNSYVNLEKVSKDFKNIVAGRTTVGNVSGWNPDDNFARQKNQDILREAGRVLNDAHLEYAKQRSYFAIVLDKAAVERYDVTRYANMETYFTPPNSYTVSYDVNRQVVVNGAPNKYAVPGLR